MIVHDTDMTMWDSVGSSIFVVSFGLLLLRALWFAPSLLLWCARSAFALASWTLRCGSHGYGNGEFGLGSLFGSAWGSGQSLWRIKGKGISTPCVLFHPGTFHFEAHGAKFSGAATIVEATVGGFA